MIASGWKFWIQKEEESYYPCREIKSADQLRGYCKADLCLYFTYANVGFLMMQHKSSKYFPWLSKASSIVTKGLKVFMYEPHHYKTQFIASAKTKMQIICYCTIDQCLYFATQIEQSLFIINTKLKFLAFSCDCSDWICV